MKTKAVKSLEVVVDVTCDACVKRVVPDIQKVHQADLYSFTEFGVLQASYGYGSNHDGENFHFEICEECFSQLVETLERLRQSSGLNPSCSNGDAVTP